MNSVDFIEQIGKRVKTKTTITKQIGEETMTQEIYEYEELTIDEVNAMHMKWVETFSPCINPCPYLKREFVCTHYNDVCKKAYTDECSSEY